MMAGEVLPDEPTPVRLMNTVWADADGPHDDLQTATQLRDWLVTIDPTAVLPTPSLAELSAAVRLRDSLRRLAAFATDDDRPAAASRVGTVNEAVVAVNAAIAHLPRTGLMLQDGRLCKHDRTRSTPIQVALAHVASASVELLTPPASDAMRACHAPGCVLYFVKTHHRRQWCSQACGNRVRAARHYQRTRAKHC